MNKSKVIRLSAKTVDYINEARKWVKDINGEFYNDVLTDDNLISIALHFWIKSKEKEFL